MGVTTVSIQTLGIAKNTTLTIMTLSIKTLSKMTFSKMTFSITFSA